MTYGGLLLQKKVSGSVDWTWYDQSQGIVQWNLENTGNTIGSFILQRGASLAGVQMEDYVFGQAFNVMYLYNGNLFGTSLLQEPPTPLINNGVENNSPPMAVVDSPTGRSICFIFTLSPGQKWSMLEGGFQNGIVPSNPILIPVSIKSKTPVVLCDSYNSEQCQGYNQQTGSNLPCPPNPWQIKSIIMETNVNIPILIQDTITDGPCSSSPQPNCDQLIEQGFQELENGNSSGIALIFSGMMCLFKQTSTIEEFEGKIDKIMERINEVYKRIRHDL